MATWESESAISVTRPEMIKPLDDARHILEEISPEMIVIEEV